MKIELRGLPGPFLGKTIQLPEGNLTIGREKDCQLRIESGFVSRHHCLLRVDETGAYVRDLGSKNGTSINGTRLTTKEAVLRHGDLLTVGEVAFQVDFGPDAVRQPESEVPTSDICCASQQTAQFNADTVQTQAEIAAASSAAPPPVDSTLFRVAANVPLTPPATDPPQAGP